MIASISTVYMAEQEHMWKELQKTSSLIQVSSPILKFRPLDGGSLPEEWRVGKEYQLRLSLFGVLPLGTHTIRLQKIDAEEREILSFEGGGLADTWNHRIRLETLTTHSFRYTDEIEIRAGKKTNFIWLFAQVFYRHRQRKWRRLLQI